MVGRWEDVLFWYDCIFFSVVLLLVVDGDMEMVTWVLLHEETMARFSSDRRGLTSTASW